MTKLEEIFKNSKEKKFVAATHCLFNCGFGFSADEIAEMLFAFAMHIRLLIRFDDIKNYVDAVNVEFIHDEEACDEEACAGHYIKYINEIEAA